MMTEMRLAKARAEAARARAECLAIEAEGWDRMESFLPVHNSDGELTGLLSVPATRASDVWGLRLAYDLLGCCDGVTDVDEAIGRYFNLIRDPQHAMLVYGRALHIIAGLLAPQLLDDDVRLGMAVAATEAWKARVNDRPDPSSG